MRGLRVEWIEVEEVGKAKMRENIWRESGVLDAKEGMKWGEGRASGRWGKGKN